jgi:hypothetical protein
MNLYFPISYAIRNLFENYRTTITDPMVYLQTVPLISPSYITFVPKNGNPHVIVRDPMSSRVITNVVTIQTNHDTDRSKVGAENIIQSFERHTLCRVLLQSKVNFDNDNDVITTFLTFPINNDETIYACVMNPTLNTCTAVIPE